MREIQSDLVLSFGTNCEITYNLRKFFGVESAGLFDWMITPISALPGLIERGFEFSTARFPEDCRHVRFRDGGDSVLHMPTGILLHHAFSRDADGKIVEFWRDEIPSVIEKHAFLGARMAEWLSRSKRAVIFVNKTGKHEFVDKSSDERSYQKIIAALERKFPTNDFIIVFTNPVPDAIGAVTDDNRVRSIDVQHLGKWHDGVVGHFAGCSEGWREALSSLKIRLTHV